MNIITKIKGYFKSNEITKTMTLTEAILLMSQGITVSHITFSPTHSVKMHTNGSIIDSKFDFAMSEKEWKRLCIRQQLNDNWYIKVECNDLMQLQELMM